MNTYPIAFYDLLSLALGGNDPYKLQSYLDEVIANKYNTLDVAGFPWAPTMTPDFTYEQVVKSLDIIPMAQYTDLDSPAVPIGTKGLQSYTGKVPRMKLVEYYNEDKIRKIMLASRRLNAMSIASSEVRNAARDTLFVTLDTLVGGHTNSLSYQRHQMVSKGILEINASNNPQGVSGVKIAAHIPTKNISKLAGTARWFTAQNNGKYTTEGTAADPIANLTDMVDNANNLGIRSLHFEMEKNYAKQILNHSKVIEAIAVNMYTSAANETWALNAAKAVSFENKLRILGEIVGAPIHAIDHVSTTQKFNKNSQVLEDVQLKAFEPGVIVLVPDGNLGEIVAVEPIVVGDQAATYASFYGGRLLCTVTYDASKKTQAFETELTALTVPNKPQYMFYLYPTEL